MTQARLEANRRNAKRSTGPRTVAGKAWSRMNGLRHGNRSPEFLNVVYALSCANPGAILRVGDSCLTSAQRKHPAYCKLVEVFTEAEIGMMEAAGWRRERAQNFS